MNSERIAEQPGEANAKGLTQPGDAHDHIQYLGPLKDPTKQPVEEAVRPPPAPKPWGVQGEALLPWDYLAAFADMAGRMPQFLSRLIQTTPYLVQIESAQGYPEAIAELVSYRRLERRWLKAYLGKQSFTRLRRAGELRHLFDWPKPESEHLLPDLTPPSPRSPSNS